MLICKEYRVLGESRKSSGVQSVERSLDIIETLVTEPHGMGISQISESTGMSKSTVHRLLSTLLERGYVTKTHDSSYKVGLKLIEAASVYLNSLELHTEARPYISRIAHDLGLTSHLGIIEGDQVVYIERMDMISSIQLYHQIGLRVPAYTSSLGKCLLSAYSHEELELVMKDCTFQKFTDKTITSFEEFRKEMHEVRKKGWAIDDQESEEDHRCIGAPIFDYRGDIIAAVSASGSLSQLPDERIEAVAEYLKSTALEISREMGYSG